MKIGLGMGMTTSKWATRRGLDWLLGLVLILLSVNYFPNLPNASLDSSWMNGIGVALADGAVPGRDLLFTYGPLAAMTTGYWGYGFFLGLALSLAIAFNLAWLMRATFGARFLAAAAIIFLLAPSNEALFYLYVMVLPLAIVRHLAGRPDDQAAPADRVALLAAAVLLPALTLSKLSFAPVSIAVLLLACGYAASQRRRAAALLLPIIALASMGVLWLLAGQDVRNLPLYLFDGEIIAGYTGAMEWDLGTAVAGINLQLVETLLLYGMAALLLLWSAARLKFDRAGKLYVVASLGVVLLVVIKAAVVRHGGVHSIFPWILLAVLALHFLSEGGRDIGARVVLAVSLFASLAFSVIYSGDGTGITKVVLSAKSYALQHDVDWQVKKKSLGFWLHYAGADTATFVGSLPPVLMGASERIDNARELVLAVATSGRSVTQAIAKANDQINATCDIPHTDGSADIYPTDINCLTAKGVHWTPRPVFQSYSAYTPQLLQVNRRHLQGSGAPDHVYFEVKPIDDRFPALEDGDSWACLAANYRPDGAERPNILLLKKIAAPQACPAMRPMSSQRGVLGQAMHLGCDRPKVFASLGFTRNLAGRLSTVFYKQRRLVVDVKLCGGDLVSYKFVPGMAQTPFLLSPVVSSAQDFGRLFFGGIVDPARKVDSFTVRYGDSESPVRGWNPDFEFKTYALPDPSASLASPLQLMNRN